MSLLEIPILKRGTELSPIYPACHLPVLLGITRIRNLVVRIISVNEILQDSTAFPDFELLAVLVLVDDGWDATVGVDVEIPLLFLLMFKELDWVYLRVDYVRNFCFFLFLWGKPGAVRGSYIVLQAQFLEGNGDLEGIRSALAIERNVVLLSAHRGRR